MVELNGTELTIEQVMAVARHKEQVRISEPAKQKIDRARAYVDEKLAQKAVIYGLTTGFGKFSDTFVPEQETAALQRNLIISHACGMGAPLPCEVVRGAMLLRCNALARGNPSVNAGNAAGHAEPRCAPGGTRKRFAWRERRSCAAVTYRAGHAG